MNEHDQQRFAKMIIDFVEGYNFERPFHLVVIDARGTASVTRPNPSPGSNSLSPPSPARGERRKKATPLKRRREVPGARQIAVTGGHYSITSSVLMPSAFAVFSHRPSLLYLQHWVRAF